MSAWEQQLSEWSDWLDQHLDDPALIAGCHRIGKRLAESGRA
jgi:hypothetical protein